MNNEHAFLSKVRDTINGFTGTITERNQSHTGRVQYKVESAALSDSMQPITQWIDAERLAKDDGTAVGFVQQNHSAEAP